MRSCVHQCATPDWPCELVRAGIFEEWQDAYSPHSCMRSEFDERQYWQRDRDIHGGIEAAECAYHRDQRHVKTPKALADCDASRLSVITSKSRPMTFKTGVLH